MTDSTILLDLAATISNAALTITRHNLQQSKPAPSFLPESSRTSGITTNGVSLAGKKDNSESQNAAISLIQAATDLQILVSGPENYLKSLSYSYHDITAIAVVIEFDLASKVPLSSSISFSELSAISGCPIGRLQRVLRLLFVRRIFQESQPGYVGHTSISELLAIDQDLTAFLGHCTHEAFPAASRLVDSIRQYPDTEEPSQAGFNIAFNTTDPLFTFLSKHPDRFDRFNRGMAGLSKSGGRSDQQVVDGFPWDSLGKALVVDVGGGNGHVSLSLAEAYPQLSFVVQDLEAAISSVKYESRSTLQDRVHFEIQDMFQTQTRRGVDVFYLRHILHDWPDDYAVKILKNLVPALRPESRIIISDSVIPPPEHLHGLHEKFVRYLDMQMMVLHNARERTEEDFAQLLARADPRLKLRKVWRRGPDTAASTIIEVVFEE
ncbi:S-adenosyl-L-methionine-dependent methyltransferase [Talaromyces proteolyticus]|uniref:S-adenosyl-L-methionine-dependent methyltransferase n=1 Tax=Talaromyces proteolyticus TaxID=1131652 RepID=A0AAD4PV93_9EURO|nr:S-adenosyl-L-methionine-dependent methyltransferase [Talaromyces proteolyticus]KAH8690473.1 S-adenosyl-L-methionine-dependent methyltransferase [Talaromyces proteolyticus]